MFLLSEEGLLSPGGGDKGIEGGEELADAVLLGERRNSEGSGTNQFPIRTRHFGTGGLVGNRNEPGTLNQGEQERAGNTQRCENPPIANGNTTEIGLQSITEIRAQLPVQNVTRFETNTTFPLFEGKAGCESTSASFYIFIFNRWHILRGNCLR